ncbi:MAG: helix-turn-helix domain-containing protein [Oscillospiraceae bacterium]|nr:helix-turn-helix domain-containing protein [Oscillospiraceae bacterium]
MTGNIIYSNKQYIAGVSDTFGAKLHRHPLLEIYAAEDGHSHVRTENGELSGQIIVIGANAVHAIADSGKRGIALFIDPLTEYGYALARNTLKDDDFSVINTDGAEAGWNSDGNELSEENIKEISDSIINLLQGERSPRPFDDAVLRAIELIGRTDCDYEMDSIAQHVFLSKSRLAHIFSAQTGITLKEYLQYKRLENACRKMLGGSTVTAAAFDTGFSGPSHIAASSMKLTGLQLRRLLDL